MTLVRRHRAGARMGEVPFLFDKRGRGGNARGDGAEQFGRGGGASVRALGEATGLGPNLTRRMTCGSSARQSVRVRQSFRVGKDGNWGGGRGTAVQTPLISVSQICDAGLRVVFTRTGGFIQHDGTG